MEKTLSLLVTHNARNFDSWIKRDKRTERPGVLVSFRWQLSLRTTHSSISRHPNSNPPTRAQRRSVVLRFLRLNLHVVSDKRQEHLQNAALAQSPYTSSGIIFQDEKSLEKALVTIAFLFVGNSPSTRCQQKHPTTFDENSHQTNAPC